jgi:hypothetical protein
MSSNESFINRYFDELNYEDPDQGRLRQDVRLVERSEFNTLSEIKKYEELNAKAEVKITKVVKRCVD